MIRKVSHISISEGSGKSGIKFNKSLLVMYVVPACASPKPPDSGWRAYMDDVRCIGAELAREGWMEVT